jgi:tellurite resistance protein
MTSYTDRQITDWLRGLLTVAWADGDFGTAERAAIIQLTQTELALDLDLSQLESISAKELSMSFRNDPQIAENFLRTAMMVALADGVYSLPEATILREFHQALSVDTKVLNVLASTITTDANNVVPLHRDSADKPVPMLDPASAATAKHDVLAPVREWLDGLEINDPRLARLLCKFIPAQCPFERDIVLFGNKIVHIPPLCTLNPLFDQIVSLRFRALSYLADDCREDVSAYIGA